MQFPVFAGDLFGQAVQRLHGCGLRQALAEHGVQDLDLEVRDQAGNLFHRLTAPAVGADDGGKFQLRPQGISQVRGVKDSRVSSDMHGWRTHDQCGGIHQGHGQLTDIG